MKKLLLLLIVTILPFNVWAENISGDMYVAPAHFTQQTPAPTTNATPSYGRVNIDTDDQSHAASTAYVKGAYNSAIAAVNKVSTDKQDVLFEDDNGEYIDSAVMGKYEFVARLAQNGSVEGDARLVTAGVVENVYNTVQSKRVKVFTTWDDDTQTTNAQLVTE